MITSVKTIKDSQTQFILSKCVIKGESSVLNTLITIVTN